MDPCRTCLLLCLLTCMQATWLLENPASSAIVIYPRLIWVLKMLKRIGSQAFCQHYIKMTRYESVLVFALHRQPSAITCVTFEAFHQKFWMRLHGGESPKRTLILSNTQLIGQLDQGKLSNSGHTLQTTVKYVNSKGEACYHGNGSSLKQTQSLGYETSGIFLL